jgi:integrase
MPSQKKTAKTLSLRFTFSKKNTIYSFVYSPKKAAKKTGRRLEMTIKWTKVEDVKGLRYKEHQTRLYKKRKDRYFTAYYKLNGKDKSESFGWESDGWTVEKAVAILQELKQNRKTGEGPQSLAEKRERAKKQKEEKETKTKEDESKIITFSQMFETYYTTVKNQKTEKRQRNIISIYENWLKEKIGNMPLDTIIADDLQSIADNALQLKRKPATVHYIISLAKTVLDFAIDRELYKKDNIARKVKIPKYDGNRTRFLSIEEAQKLLNILKERDKQVHNMTLFSMYTGARRGEIFSLCWEHINFDTKFMTFFDTKNKKTRHVPLLPEVEEMLKDLKKPGDRGFVFKTKDGKKFENLPHIFFIMVEKVGLNDGITDPRQRVVFHTLRHSYASWLVMHGADLFAVKELMGHSSTAMTERYSHLSPEHLKKTASLLNKYTTASPQ